MWTYILPIKHISKVTMRTRTSLFFYSTGYAILLFTYSSAYSITSTLHNQLIKKDQSYTSRLLKKNDNKTKIGLNSDQQKPLIDRRHGRHRRYNKKEVYKTFSKMKYEELEQAKNRQIIADNKEVAIKYLEQMLKLCDNINKLAQHLVELADLLFDCSKFEKAGKIYTEFTNLYPGNQQIEYASYRAILCSFYQTLDIERDQTKTEETIQLTDNFLERIDIFRQYKDEVHKIRTACHQKLVASEINICTFYIKKNSYQSAQKRLDSLRMEWLPKIPAVESQIITLEIALAEKKGNEKIVAQKQQELKKKYPQKIITVAKNKNMAHWF